MKKLSTAKLCLIALLMAGCGPAITAARAILAASHPFIQSLVTAKKITQEHADTAWRDVSEGVDDFAALDVQLRKIPKTDSKNLQRLQKAEAYEQLVVKLRTILERHNIAGAPELDEIKAITESAIAALEEYFRSVTGANAVSEGMSSAAADQVAQSDDADAKLEKAMKQMRNKLKAVMSQK